MAPGLAFFFVPLYAVLEDCTDGLGKLIQAFARNTVAKDADGMSIGILFHKGAAFGGIGQGSFIEEKDGGFVSRHSPKLRVTGADGDTGIQHFNDDVDVFQVFGDQTASFGHVTGEPLNVFAWHG